MESKPAIVINDKGNKVEFVFVDSIYRDDKISEEPYAHIMRTGESLVYDDLQTALSMTKPLWNGTSWEETATPEEIAAATPEPESLKPTENQILGQMITDMELAGIIQGQQATDLELRILELEVKANV